jgi:AraC family L-rhamnose operon transcriptional activator RhaR
LTCFPSLVENDADIRLAGLVHIRAFALYRRHPISLEVECDLRRRCHAILYLRGVGNQVIANSDTSVEPGLFVILPAGQPLSFHPTITRMPLCLTVDFDLEETQPRLPVISKITRSELTQTRQQLAYLIRLQQQAGVVYRWESSALILHMLIMLLRTAGWVERVPQLPNGRRVSAMHRMLFTLAPETPLRQVVLRSGYQQDHLNRLVKRETGLSLGQFRIQRRLAKAKELLSRGGLVANVSDAVGLFDQSYFARWFRRQTGMSPTRWKQQGLDRNSPENALKYG